MSLIKISVVGDVLIHGGLLKKAQDSGDLTFSNNLAPIQTAIKQSHIASANLESITAGARYGLSGYPRFNAPVELLEGLKNTGFKLLNVANNHMLDKGEEALIDSLSNIKYAGLIPIGAAPSANDSTEYVYDINGIRIGFVSFTDASKIKTTSIKTSKINHFPGESEPVRMFKRLNTIRSTIKELKARADVVVLQLHYGEEYLRYPSSFQKEFITMICESDVDVVIGHHPHVLQPSEWIENSKGRKVLVHYSLGNFFSGQIGLHRQIGGIFSFFVDTNKSESSKYFPIVDPEVQLTFVDSQDSFKVKLLREVAEEKDKILSVGVGFFQTKDLYNSVISHGETFSSEIRIY